MGPPITRLNEALVLEHPALAAFSRYISNHQQAAPNPADIEVAVDRPNDGVLNLAYFGKDNYVYAGQLDANTQLLKIRRGPFRGSQQIQFGPIEEQGIAGSCLAVQTLGGDQETSLQCSQPPAPTGDFRAGASYTAGALVTQWSFFEAALWRRRARISPRTWSERGQIGLSSAAALLGYNLAAYPLGDALGLHPVYHARERTDLGVGLGYGLYRGSHHLLNRRFGGNIRPTSLASGILTGALVEAVLRNTMNLDPQSSITAFGIGFLYPQIFSTAIGSRPLAFTQTPRMQKIGRWGGRVVLAAFAADAGYMLTNYLSNGGSGSARQNRIYAEAYRLQGQDSGVFGNVVRGAFHFVAPSLTERVGVGSQYVDRVRTELRSQVDHASQNSEAILRHSLLFGGAGHALDPNFYTRVDLSPLAETNSLADVRNADGKLLPVWAVSEQLADPEIRRRVLEESSPEEQIDYIRRQFRGHRLSRTDAAEILARISLHHARAQIGELEFLATPEEAPLLRYFDGQGRLRDGQSDALVSHLFSEQRLDSEQLLAMRRVVLSMRILELQNAGSDASELAAHTQVARQIGLTDEHGNLLDREETLLARAQIAERSPTLQPTPTPPVTTQDMILETIAMGS